MFLSCSPTVVTAHTCIPVVVQGGALYVGGGTVTVTSTTFIGNTATKNNGNAIYQKLGVMTITNAIAKSIHTDDLFSIVVQEVISLLNCDRATMWLLTDHRSTLFSMLQPMPIRKDSTPIRAEVPISNNSLSGSATLNEEVINLKDAYDDPRFSKATDAKTGKVDTSELAKYTASVAYDLWSFGVVLFHLCYGISLFNTDQNDNVSLPDLSSLASWTAGVLNRKILEAGTPRTRDVDAATDLIKKLLVSDPEERCKSFTEGVEMSSVLKHPFFQVGGDLEVKKQLDRIEEEQDKQTAMLVTIDTRTKEINKRTITMVHLQRETILQLNKHANSLRTCIQVRALMHPVPRAHR